MPGVSTRAISAPALRATPRTRLRVVCGLSETIATFSPTRRLTSVDFPTLGRPTTDTSPARKGPSAIRFELLALGSLRRARLGARRRADGRRRRAFLALDPHAVDAPAVRLLDREEEVRLGMRLPGPGNVTQARRQESADGREFLLLRPAPEELPHRRDVLLARDGIRAVARPRDRLPLVLVLVGDLPDDLLQEVLDGDEAGHAAIFVHDDR